MPEVDRFGRLPWLWTTVLVFVPDRLSKAPFQAELSTYQQIVATPDLFSWTLAYNTGVVFSFLADSPGWQCWLLTLIAIVTNAILAIWLKRLKKGETRLVAVLALVLDGVLGNLYDCMVPGHVVDFILMHWQNRWYFPAFNLADSIITVGVVMLAPDMSRSKKSGETAYD